MVISGVKKKSIAEQMGIKAGDSLISLGGFPVTDILDYQFYDAANCVEMQIRTKSGQLKSFKPNKAEGESLGLSFKDDYITLKNCCNNCIFCFVSQMPPDTALRPSLRVKDDDYRFSFLNGTYITGTNLTDFCIARIKRLRLSPLYLSVHTVCDGLRRKMLRNPEAPSILPLIKQLFDAGIQLHTQIVYCPDYNEDIEVSARALAPYCQSLAVVPVGLTRYCNPEVRAVTKADAERILSLTERLQNDFLAEKGTRFVWVADEFYLLAEKEPVLTEEFYEGYPQIENGVGLTARFEADLSYALSSIKRKKNAPQKSVSVATGVAAYPFIQKAAERVAQKFGSEVLVHRVENRFFGSSVTVAGLLTGSDLAYALKEKPLQDKLLLPSVMFREGGEEFLDNMTRAELSRILGVSIHIIPSDGESFVRGIVHG
ncbi:MAG: DUF512 domain-containing protein [Firmicutes bacterium]|nr:DUF512 domain-containing protein [Bacillota bacterium]